MEILFCSIVVVLYLIRINFYKTDPFHPVTLILFFNFLTLGISYTAIDNRWVPLEGFTWLVVLASSLALILGQITATHYTKSYELQNKIHVENLFNNWSWKNYHIILWIVFFIFLLGMFYRSALSGGIPLFQAGQDQMSRSSAVDMGIFNIYLLRGPGAFAFILLGAYKRINPHTWLRWLCIFMATFTLILSFMVFQSRMNIMTSVIVVAFYHHYLVKPLGLKHFLIIGIVFSFLFLTVASLRMQYLNEDTSDGIKAILRLPYIYIANNWWNTDFGLNQIPGHPFTDKRWGYGLIEGITHFFPGGAAFQEAMGWDTIFNESVEKFQGLNTVTWHYKAWEEFGILGVTIVPFIFGVFSEFLFNHFKREPRFESFLIFSILSGYFILSWFEEFYQSGNYIWRLLFLFLAAKAVYINRLTNLWQRDI